MKPREGVPDDGIITPLIVGGKRRGKCDHPSIFTAASALPEQQEFADSGGGRGRRCCEDIGFLHSPMVPGYQTANGGGGGGGGYERERAAFVLTCAW